VSPTANVTATFSDRFSGGKIAEDWYQSDDLGMMQQLGVIPSEETSEEASPT
jgi:hypothetical protein